MAVLSDPSLMSSPVRESSSTSSPVTAPDRMSDCRSESFSTSSLPTAPEAMSLASRVSLNARNSSRMSVGPSEEVSATSSPVSVPSTTSTPRKLCTSNVLMVLSLTSPLWMSSLRMSMDLTSPSTMSVLKTVLAA